MIRTSGYIALLDMEGSRPVPRPRPRRTACPSCGADTLIALNRRGGDVVLDPDEVLLRMRCPVCYTGPRPLLATCARCNNERYVGETPKGEEMVAVSASGLARRSVYSEAEREEGEALHREHRCGSVRYVA